MICDDCGKPVQIGSWPWCPHSVEMSRSKGFEPYWDKNITDHPVWISNPGDKRKYLRPQWKDDMMIHTYEKD